MYAAPARKHRDAVCTGHMPGLHAGGKALCVGCGILAFCRCFCRVDAGRVSVPETVPPERFHWPGKFNTPTLDPLQVTGVLVNPSAARMHGAFRTAMGANSSLTKLDEDFEVFVLAMRPGDLVLSFTRTTPSRVEDGIALFRAPNQILKQLVLCP